MISNGQNILALDQRGVLMLIEHNPAEFKLLGEREVTKEESWAHLAIAGDKVLVRHLKGNSVLQLECLGRNASKASRHALESVPLRNTSRQPLGSGSFGFEVNR